MDLLDTVSRWIHILAAAVAVGGLIHARWVAYPAMRALGEEQRRSVISAMSARLRSLALGVLAAVFVTGSYNLFRSIELGVPSQYHMVFGIKFLLAMHVLAMLFVASSEKDDSHSLAKRPRLILGGAISGLLVFALGAYLKSLHG